jgi:hypothetical protein
MGCLPGSDSAFAAETVCLCSVLLCGGKYALVTTQAPGPCVVAGCAAGVCAPWRASVEEDEGSARMWQWRTAGSLVGGGGAWPITGPSPIQCDQCGDAFRRPFAAEMAVRRNFWAQHEAAVGGVEGEAAGHEGQRGGRVGCAMLRKGPGQAQGLGQLGVYRAVSGVWQSRALPSSEGR